MRFSNCIFLGCSDLGDITVIIKKFSFNFFLGGSLEDASAGSSFSFVGKICVLKPFRCKCNQYGTP